MHWGSTSKVKTTHLEDPSGGVPSPASNRIVDESRPDKHEDDTRELIKKSAKICSTTLDERRAVFASEVERGKGVVSIGKTYHTTSLCDSANSKCDSDGGEHALVDSKQEIGNLAGAYGRSSQGVAEPNVFQITEELARGVGESERETPEEPLEGDDCSGHDREPD